MADETPSRARLPYADLHPRAYWHSDVAGRGRFDPGDLYQPRFPVTPAMRIVTGGSCFAQHVGRALREAGFDVLDAEPLPWVSGSVAHRFGYRLYSARYGNIYTARQLAQLFDEAEGRFVPADPVWRRGDRFHDAQRPNVEPEGLDSAAARSKAAEAAERVNGAAAIDLCGMDAVVLYGGAFPHQQLAEVMATFDVDGYRAAGAARRLSRPAFEAVCDDLAQASLPDRRWLGAEIPRIAAFLRPLPARNAAASGFPTYAGWHTVAARPDGARAMLERLFSALAACHTRHRIDFLRQLPETLDVTGLTVDVYSRGSRRLAGDEPHRKRDFAHMNARYGALCLQQILDWAGQRVPASA
jgi:hypothetical protein